ncbi:MAG: radical SAM protein [Actinobacteria bacterium]|nr:radical SAM protein [Actinomycetota bacterium]
MTEAKHHFSILNEEDNNKLPIHLFTYADRKFFFDIPTSYFVETDNNAFEILSNLESLSPSGKIHLISKSGNTYSSQKIEEIFQEMEQLKNLGFFKAEVPEQENEINQYLHRLLKRRSSHITLCVSQACNMSCKYCYAEGGNFGKKALLMSEETALRAVDYLFEKTKGIQEIGLIFFGGEPLLNFKVIKKAVEYSRKLAQKTGQRIGFSLTTNGTIMNDEIIEFLCTNRFGLKVSMDGPKSVQDDMRPLKTGEGSYDLVAKNLKSLLKRRGHLSVRPTLTRHNIEMNNLANFFEEFGFTRIGFGIAEGSCFAKEDYDFGPEEFEKIFFEYEKTVNEILDRLDKKIKVPFNPFENLLNEIHTRRKTRVRCGLARGVSTIAVDGRIYPCHRYVGMDAFVIGNLETGIDKEKAFQILKDYYNVKKYCWQTCWARHICGGPCPFYVAHPSGTHYYPDEGHCRFVRKSYELGIWFYDQLAKRHPQVLEKWVGSSG